MRARMGGWDVFQFVSCLSVGLILSHICINIEGQSVPGFLSIDCGATIPYNDAVTKFSWEGDSKYTSTGMSGQVPFPISTADNSEALQTFRYFPDRRSKHCYELPTTANTSFLLRAMFLHGFALELTLPIAFDVAVNGSYVFSVTFDVAATNDDLTKPLMWEGILFSPGSLTHLCLLTNTGVPFISSLEIRELDPDGIMYSFKGSTGLFLHNFWRLNCGAQQGSPTVRYPDDPFDRLWATPGDWASGLGGATGKASNSTTSSVNNVPPKVMQEAWLNDEPNSTIEFWFAFQEPIGLAYMVVYYEEIEANASSANRLFEINVNGHTDVEKAATYAIAQYYESWSVPGTEVNFTLTGLGSPLGPIVNAFELYLQYQFNDSATAPQDVDTLATLQESFNLTDWQGDPCYPVSWDWVSCTADTPARVDKLLLSSMGIKASIPPSISNLDALTQIHLDNNSLDGIIPDSLAFLPHLTSLYLNDNDLSGDIPPDLLKKLGTDFYYSGNSLLGALSPSSGNSTAATTKKKSTDVGIIVGIIGGLVAIVALGLLTCYLCIKKTKKPQPNHVDKVELVITAKQTVSTTSSPVTQIQAGFTNLDHDVLPHVLAVKHSTELAHVSYETVKDATNNFTVKIGEGSYGSVFHGWLNNKEVAVKLNNIQSDQGHAEFITEVEILTRVHHRNLVSLIGYCNEGNKLILIYEFEVNGTLREWIRDAGQERATLDWNKRLQIAIDGARGLEYLHKGCDPTIIHRDVKSSNILLDSSMTAKVADFGLSKSTLGENTTGYTTGVKGTPGYLDPEYHKLGRLTHKSDVYSYGVVLAEIITGLPPFKMQTGSSQIILVDRVRKLVERNDIEALADPKLQGVFNPESMWRMADITLSCIDPVGARRPDFTKVVTGINEAIEFERNFALHSPVAPLSSSFILRSNSHHRYQNLP